MKFPAGNAWFPKWCLTICEDMQRIQSILFWPNETFAIGQNNLFPGLTFENHIKRQGKSRDDGWGSPIQSQGRMTFSALGGLVM